MFTGSTFRFWIAEFTRVVSRSDMTDAQARRRFVLGAADESEGLNAPNEAMIRQHSGKLGKSGNECNSDSERCGFHQLVGCSWGILMSGEAKKNGV